MRGFFIDEPDQAEFTEFVENTFNALADSKAITHSVDMVPYTDDFERIYAKVNFKFPSSKHDVWVKLVNLRKQGKCPAPK